MSVLILSKQYFPLKVISNKKAATMIVTESARPTEVGPEFADKRFADDNLIQFRLSNGYFFTFNDVIVASTNYYIRRKPPYPSNRIIWLRDNYICTYCTEKIDRPTVDHIIPVSKGGKDTYKNLITSCVSCNSQKGNMSLDEFLVKYNKIMHYEPKIPAADFALFYSNKAHWNEYLFY